MAQDGNPRGRSIGGALILIGIGLVFLLFQFKPAVNPWPYVVHYWPLILIFLGIGKLWDYARQRQNPGAQQRPWISGGSLAVLLLLGLFALAAFRGGRHTYGEHHMTRTVDRPGAQSLRAHLEMPAGELTLTGGSANLLDADFRYSDSEGDPTVSYNVSNGAGDLTISQGRDGSIHIGDPTNEWKLKLPSDLPVDLSLQMGAGQGNLRLRDVAVTNLSVNMGAGQLDLDLTGDRKKDLVAEIHGGLGQANIRLPRNVGVRVEAHGGIGSIENRGFHHDGDEYVNDAYGKSPVSIKMTVHGGIGEIVLEQEP